MKFSICNELYYDRSFEAACAHARSLGYQGLEIAPFTLGSRPTDISQAARREFREIAARHELEIVGLHWLLAKTKGLHLTTADGGVRERTGAYLSELVTLCADLGGSVMVLGSPQQRNLEPGTRYEIGFERACELIRRIVPALESSRVTLAIEPLGPEETNFLKTAQQAVEFIQAIGSPHVGLILDVKAMATESVPIPSIIESNKDHLVHFHANDPNRQGPGMGKVDFRPIADTLARIAYQGWVSVEVFDYRPGIEELAARSMETLQSSWPVD
jgi:sugar phosphate isomerase/epimerase